jgi:hypothetical protein
MSESIRSNAEAIKQKARDDHDDNWVHGVDGDALRDICRSHKKRAEAIIEQTDQAAALLHKAIDATYADDMDAYLAQVFALLVGDDK